MMWPLWTREFSAQLSTGVEWRHYEDRWLLPGVTGIPAFDALAITGALSLNTTRWPRRSHSPHSGFRALAAADYVSTDSNLIYYGPSGLTRLQAYSPRLAADGVLRATGLYAMASGNAQPLELGGLQGLVDDETAPMFRLRGYPAGLGALTGTRLAITTVDWYMPLTLIERGILFPPINLHRLNLRLFTEAGKVWTAADPGLGWLPSVGAELDTRSWIGFKAPLTLSLGVAHGLGQFGLTQYYVDIRLGN